MARYFKATEISEEDYFAATGERLGYFNCCVSPEKDGVYVAVSEQESCFEIEVDDFDFVGTAEVM